MPGGAVAWRWPGNQEDVWPDITYVSRISCS
jgi:hypothetical protein